MILFVHNKWRVWLEASEGYIKYYDGLKPVHWTLLRSSSVDSFQISTFTPYWMKKILLIVLFFRIKMLRTELKKKFFLIIVFFLFWTLLRSSAVDSFQLSTDIPHWIKKKNLLIVVIFRIKMLCIYELTFAKREILVQGSCSSVNYTKLLYLQMISVMGWINKTQIYCFACEWMPLYNFGQFLT